MLFDYSGNSSNENPRISLNLSVLNSEIAKKLLFLFPQTDSKTILINTTAFKQRFALKEYKTPFKSFFFTPNAIFLFPESFRTYIKTARSIRSASNVSVPNQAQITPH